MGARGYSVFWHPQDLWVYGPGGFMGPLIELVKMLKMQNKNSAPELVKKSLRFCPSQP